MTEYGDLTVSRHTDEQGNYTFTAEWVGPSIILISHELMDDHTDPPFHRDGESVTICQYNMKIIARTERGDYVMERIE